MIHRTFDDFTILKLLGAGNMGEVYLAQQNSLARQVAIKIMTKHPSNSNENFERFMREARIAASLHHPNITAVYAVGSQNNFAYIAMEYIDGTSLDEYINKKLMPQEEALKILLQLCEGLNTALKGNIIHRDIKPANIIIDKNNNIKITDFGLSKRTDGGMDITKTGMILGSPGYMSPEQAIGKKVDFRADIYSLGATFYQMLTQRMPFSADTIADMIYKHRFEKVNSPRNFNPNLDDEVCFIIAKMLRKEPEQRYQSYEEIIGDIEAFFVNKNVMSTGKIDAKEIYNNFRMKKRGFSSMFSSQGTLRKTQRRSAPLKRSFTTRRVQRDILEKEANAKKDLEEKKQQPTSTSPHSNLVTNSMMIETFSSKDQGFLEHLVKQGMLTPEQAQHAKILQDTLNRKVGQICIELEFLTEDDVNMILQLQKSSGKYFGDITVKEGLMTYEEFQAVLQKQSDSYVDMYKVLLYDNVLPDEILQQQYKLFLGDLV
ncbi:serine/threonine-protein kinase [Candidatus Uabimicrobium amorphum]|uniref:non-specific serine/threonine protein kinase n=1 Tax=Uabimicrobium amorphum TaxID=2596890 RepID=A0A5S9ILQ1_UABAM|nr:serine/threonine-protein kinase [Candidatus Uabimicrobium amorphum]BBM83837.1 protein kinase [Candidatus Uabimicrobium amorphum]